jgi:predicted SnoaL-like aldol condensation-catalyzing enzyme
MKTPENNHEIIELLCAEVFNGHSFKMLDQYMRDDYIQHNEDVPQGKDGFKQFFTNTFKSIPDFGYTIKHIVAEGDFVMLHAATTGTHTGGEWLDHPPTGNKINIDVVDIFRFLDGKIAEHWDVADTFSLFSQVGVIEDRLAKMKPKE